MYELRPTITIWKVCPDHGGCRSEFVFSHCHHIQCSIIYSAYQPFLRDPCLALIKASTTHENLVQISISTAAKPPCAYYFPSAPSRWPPIGRAFGGFFSGDASLWLRSPMAFFGAIRTSRLQMVENGQNPDVNQFI